MYCCRRSLNFLLDPPVRDQRQYIAEIPRPTPPPIAHFFKPAKIELGIFKYILNFLSMSRVLTCRLIK